MTTNDAESMPNPADPDEPEPRIPEPDPTEANLVPENDPIDAENDFA